MAKEGNVGWDDKSVKGSMKKLFKLETKQVARISPLSKQAFMIYDHYSQKARRHARCIKSKGMCPGCEALGEPKERFATRILMYATNATGELTKPLRLQLMVWVLSGDKFVELRSIRKQWGDLSKRDLMVTCSDGKFQKMSYVVTPKCIWRSNEKIIAKVVKMLKADKTDLEAILGKMLPPEEVSKRLGLDYETGGFEESDLEGFEGIEPETPGTKTSEEDGITSLQKHGELPEETGEETITEFEIEGEAESELETPDLEDIDKELEGL